MSDLPRKSAFDSAFDSALDIDHTVSDAAPGLPDARQMAMPLKGRGTATQIAHRFNGLQREAFDDGWAAWVEGPTDGSIEDHARAEEPHEAAPRIQTQIKQEWARSILSKNDSPDIPFTWAVNPYRGCEHGCIYCYARPTHSYLNLSPGLDFETRLVAKMNAAELLRAELAKRSYEPSAINIGSATDCYQPIERHLRLTRSVLEVLTACQHPFTVVTKSSAIERDLDLIALAASRRQCYIMITLTTLDAKLARILEPRAAAPHRRLEVVRQLHQAGIPVGVNVAPLIPFVNEPEIEHIVQAAAQAGAQSIHYTLIRLPWEVQPLFQECLQHHLPDKAQRIMARIADVHGGQTYRAQFGQRMKGAGVWAQLVGQRVRKAARRYGADQAVPELDISQFVPPGAGHGADVGAGMGAGMGAGDGADHGGVQASLFD